MSRRRKRPSQLDIDKFLFSQGIPKFELYRPPPKRRYRRKSAATSSQPSTSTQTPPSLPPEAIGSQSTQRNVTSSSSNEPVNITTDRELHDLDADSYEAPLDSSFNVEERSSTNLYTIANHNTEVTETLELQRGGDVNASQQEGRVEISEFAFLPIPETLAAIYIQELLVHQQIIGLRDESGDVAIPDFDIQNRVILVGSYIILSARWAQFPGELEGHKKVYFTCSCMNEAKVRQLETAVFGSNATYADYLKSSYNCLHAQAILLYESLLQCLNDPQRATEVEQDAVESMDPSTAISYDCASRSYGIIKGSAAQVKCISCKNATACRHIKSMDSYFAANDLSRDDFFCGQGSATSDRSSRQACISSSRVPILRKGGFKSGRHFVENDVIHLVPDREGLCSCGAEYSNRDPIEEGWLCQGESYLFDVSEIYSCAVYFIRCSNITCAGTLPYDGGSHGIFNRNNQTLITHNLFYRFLTAFGNGNTIFSFWQETRADYKYRDVPLVLRRKYTYNVFRLSWYGFMPLLDIDFQFYFTCPRCGTQPRCTVNDGTSIGFRKCHALPSRHVETAPVIPSASAHKDIVLIPDSDREIRSILLEFTTRNSSIDERKYVQLKNLLHNKIVANKNLEVYQFFMDLLYPSGAVQSPPPTFVENERRLLHALCKNSPVAALIPPRSDVLQILEKLISRQVLSSSELSLLSQHTPILCELIHHYFRHEQEMPDSILRLLDIARQKSLAACQPQNLPPQIHPVESAWDRVLSVFPTLPKVRQRRFYEKDKNTKRGGKVTHMSKKGGSRQDCEKSFVGHPVLTSGTFFTLCPHGICYGFEVMHGNESEDIPFTIHYERFETPPDTIFYDNACKLMNYTLSREPEHFQNTRFIVDKLHWVNHVGCSEAFNPAIYHWTSKINTQACEQMNSRVKKLKSSLSYMTPQNFADHLTLFLYVRNSLTLANLLNDGTITILDVDK